MPAPEQTPPPGPGQGKDPTSIVLVDRHPAVRDGMRRLLEAEADFEVVAEGDDADEAARYVVDHKPTVLILALGTPGPSSLDVIAEIRGASPATEIVFLPTRSEPTFARQALRSGVRGFLLKDATETELVPAVRSAAGRETYLQTALAMRMAIEPEDDLTDRDREVLRLIALGHTNSEIAEQLFFSVRTIETDRAHIQLKLGITGRVGLVNYALGHDLIGGVHGSGTVEPLSS